MMEGDSKRTDEVIADPKTLYFYSPADKKYRKNPATEEAWFMPPLGDFLHSFEISKTIETLGTEVLDGKSTTVIRFEYSEEGALYKRKSWVWNEKGIPLKEEIILTKESMTSPLTAKVEYKNFSFQDIPVSTFEVPEDKIIK